MNEDCARNLLTGMNRFFSTEIEVPRIRHGMRQEIETLICEEALLFAKYLRNEKQTWNSRIVSMI